MVEALNGCLKNRGISAGREAGAEALGVIASKKGNLVVPIADGPFASEKEESV